MYYIYIYIYKFSYVYIYIYICFFLFLREHTWPLIPRFLARNPGADYCCRGSVGSSADAATGATGKRERLRLPRPLKAGLGFRV